MTLPPPHQQVPRPTPIRSEADVLALVPFTLGFHPDDSLVLITLNGDDGTFHARIDLPEEPGEIATVVEMLVEAADRNRGPAPTGTLVVAYTEDECVAEAAVELLEARLVAEGFELLMAIRADGSRWFPLGAGSRDRPAPRDSEGVPYDVRTHELTTRAVLEGRVTYRNRDELVDSLAPVDPDAVEEVEAAHAALLGLDPDDREQLRLEARWLLAQVHAAVESGTVPGPLSIARMLRAVADPDVRDLAWCEVGRSDAARHADLWREVVRRSPDQLVAPAAGLLAFTAWLSGDGALAWCAVERSLHADPDNVLARLVSQALDSALPPSTWVPMDPTALPLGSA
ncbi:MAG: hypothetical protein QOK15_15 [Nocardioidaceae bacterium]|jgi:hypothetical protein|nr:hypothetical protein [Nocardioidaceae bacterium]